MRSLPEIQAELLAVVLDPDEKTTEFSPRLGPFSNAELSGKTGRRYRRKCKPDAE
jgi:hypothetical protein